MTKIEVTIFENWPKTPNKAWLKNIEKQLQNNFQRYTYLWNFLSNSLIDGTESCAPILVTEIAAASLANSIQVTKSIPCDKPVAKAPLKESPAAEESATYNFLAATYPTTSFEI